MPPDAPPGTTPRPEYDPARPEYDPARPLAERELAGQIPVVYIIVPPAATPKTLAIEFATFLGLPVSSRDSQHLLARAVTDVLRKVGCSLVLVDEVHRLDLRTGPAPRHRTS